MGLRMAPALMLYFFIFTIFSFPVFAAPDASNIQWGYDDDNGPSQWAELKTNFATCAKGKQQSPIDITITDNSDFIGDIGFHYKSVPINMINNGHTIQFDYRPGSYITIANKQYNLTQFHFHSPSEHKIGGIRGDMVMHLVHQNNAGHQVIIAIMINKGKFSPFAETLREFLPASINQTTRDKTRINIRDLLPRNRSYFTYQGSMTTPPCDEQVTWIILKSPVEMSPNQWFTFTSFYEGNIRPIQPLYGRTVKESS